MSTRNYFGLPDSLADPVSSRYVIQPLPYERTTSYIPGTRQAPQAILIASQQVELCDDETGADCSRSGIATLAPPDFPAGWSTEECLAVIHEQTRAQLARGKRIVSLGGEHTITVPLVRAFTEAFTGLQVLQFDAHADLRQAYDGDRFSHACAMARVGELAPVLAVGIRSLCQEEYQLIRTEERPVWFAHQMHGGGDWAEALLAQISGPLYITFDLDYFDPSLMPAVGTPEPGGGHWFATLTLLRRLFREKHVVGCDIVELAPQPGQHAADFIAAKLLYKMLGYWDRREARE